MDDYEGEVAQSLDHVANAIDRLGNADAATPMGALETHGKFTSEALQAIAGAIGEVAEALNRIADHLE